MESRSESTFEEKTRIARLPSASETMDALLKAHFDAIGPLGGGYKLVKTPRGEYVSLSSYDSSRSVFPDRIAAVKARAIAAKDIAEQFPNSKIFTVGRTKPAGAPSDAEVLSLYIRRELREVAGIEQKTMKFPEERMYIDELSTSTVTDMMEIVDIALTNDWHTLGLITNDWHWERASLIKEYLFNNEKRKKLFLMLRQSVSTSPEYDPENGDLLNLNSVLSDFEKNIQRFIAEKRTLSIIPAEAILEARSTRYTKIIESAHRPDAIIKVTPAQRARMEKEGAEYTVISEVPDEEGKIEIKTSRLHNQLMQEGKGIISLEDGTYRAGSPSYKEKGQENLLVTYCARKIASLK